MERITGYSRSELLTMDPNNLILDEDMDIMHRRRELRKAGKSVSSEYTVRIRRKNGKVAHILTRVIPYRYQNRNAALGTCIDITERNIALLELRSSEEKYRTLVEEALVGVYIYKENRYLVANHEMEKITGYSVTELLNLNPYSLIYSQDVSILKDREKRHLAGKSLDNQYNIRLVRKDGSIAHVLNRVQHINLRGEEAFLGNCLDLTSRFEAERALSESRAAFRDIALATADIIWETDSKMVYNMVSGRAKDILSFEPESMIGKSFFDFLVPLDVNKAKEILGNAISKGLPIEDFEGWHINRIGSHICLLTNGIPVFDENGSLTGYRGLHKDITVRKYMEEEKENLIQELQSLSSKRHEIVSICSHCKKIRTNDDDWEYIEKFIERQSTIRFSHTLCPDCIDIE